jgi:hypothetical protein
MTTATGTINYFEANFYSIEIEGSKEVYLNEVGGYLIFSKYNDNLTDADSLNVSLTNPNGSFTFLPFSKKSTGVYEVNINFTTLGTYVLRISGSCKGLNSEDGIAIICREKGIGESDLEKLKENYTLQIAILQNEINKLKQQGIELNQTYIKRINNLEAMLNNLAKEIGKNMSITNKEIENYNKTLSSIMEEISFLKVASGNQYKSLYGVMNNTQHSTNASLNNAISSIRELSGSLYNSFESFLGKFSSDFTNNFMIFGFSLTCIMLAGFGAMFMMNRSFITALRSSIRELTERMRTPPPQVSSPQVQIIPPQPQQNPQPNPYLTQPSYMVQPPIQKPSEIEIPHKNMVIKEVGLKEEEELTAEELKQFNELFKQFIEEKRRVQEKLGKTIEKRHRELENFSRLYKSLDMVGGTIEEKEREGKK